MNTGILRRDAYISTEVSYIIVLAFASGFVWESVTCAGIVPCQKLKYGPCAELIPMTFLNANALALNQSSSSWEADDPLSYTPPISHLSM